MELEDRAPHLMVPLGQWLTQPMTHIVRKEDGSVTRLITTDGLPQGCPSTPILFSLATDAPLREFYGKLARHPTFTQLHREGNASIQIMRYMDDITLVTSSELADLAFLTIKEVLEEAGMLLNMDKCTAWTTDGVTPKTR